MHGISAHSRFDDRDLDARYIVCWQRQTISSELSRQLRKHYKLATTVGLLIFLIFVPDIDFENVYMACPACI